MKNEKPLISVIIPCYNYAHFLPEAIECALSQRYPNLECIIVNDGSSDNTEEIAYKYCKQDNRITYIKQENQGVASARNTGISRAAGRYILPLDADDKIAPEYAGKAVAILEEKPNVGIVYCEARFFGSRNEFFELQPYAFPEILLNAMIFASAFFRKEDWSACGGYNPNMKDGWEDFDFWLSIIEMKRDVYKIPEVLFYYRRGHTSRSCETDANPMPLFKHLVRNHPALYRENVEFLIDKIIEIDLENRTNKTLLDEIKRSFLYRHVFRFFIQAEELTKKRFFR